ncbi:MAG: hypothetical protein PHU21_01935 [Elusimicrobia bacterium]|nr:hypothetical protein [Elusimicrobiota bacterium]
MKRIALVLAALSLSTPLWAEPPSRCPGLGSAAVSDLGQWANVKVCDHAVWALIYYSNPRNGAAKSAYLAAKEADKKKLLADAAAALGKVDAKMEAALSSGEAVLSTAAALGVITKVENQPLAVHVPAAQDKDSAVLKAQKLSIATFAAGESKPDKLDPAQGALMLGHLLSDGKGKAVAPGQMVVDYHNALVALNNQISQLIQYKLFKDLKKNLRLAETPAKTPAKAVNPSLIESLSGALAGKPEPADDMLKALQNISDMDMDKPDNQKDLSKRPILSFLDPIMRNALRVQTAQVLKSFARAQASLKGKSVKETVGGLETQAKDRKAEQARQAKLTANANILAGKMAAVLNEQRAKENLPDAQGQVTVTAQAGPKETVFTATDQRGVSAKLKTLPNTDIDKVTEQNAPGKAAELVGTKEAQAILNGDFRAARAAALKEALTPEMAPGADGKVPAPDLPSKGVLGPGGMLGGTPGCKAGGGDSLADYKKRLGEDAKEKSAQNSAARQKLEKGYDKKYQKIMSDWKKESAAITDNRVMTPDEKTAAQKRVDAKRDESLAALDKPFPGDIQAVEQAATDNQVANYAAQMRAERLLRGQATQRVEAIRDSWEKDVSAAKKNVPGEFAQYLTPELVKAYFTEQWSGGGAYYDANMNACVGQVKFSNPASVDVFVGKHLAGWCQDRAAKNSAQATKPATSEDLSRAAELRRQELLKKAAQPK